MEITAKEYAELKKKADKWDKLDEEIAEFYNDADGEYSEDNPVRKGDLCDIGEVAGAAFGWL